MSNLSERMKNLTPVMLYIHTYILYVQYIDGTTTAPSQLVFESSSSWLMSRVSCETSFDSKQPKLEPKLVSILSETRCLFRLFRFYIETACFGVSIQPKQNKNNRNKQKKVKHNLDT
jgi:hypothetical protein